ncbi:hypothetical protein ACD661_02810 [Legionella lytica]|uniref:Membrane-associated HD superfamily hydrolase n=1 Tax=Legionella lytica TaxID=96232 RepID=A0ABW8D452_9GAMM
MPEIISTQDEIAQKKKELEVDARRLAADKAKQAFFAAKEQAQALQKAAVLEEIERIKKEGVVRYDDKGNAITKQAIFEDKLRQVMGSEQSSIHDWKSSMMSLMSVLSAFVEAMNQEVNEKTSPYYVQIKHALKNGIIGMKDTLLDKLRGDPRLDLPTLVHDIQLGKDNKLEVKLQAGGEKMVVQDRDTLVAQWLDEHGFEQDPHNINGFRTKEGHHPLPDAVFKKTKDELDAFLNRSSLKLPQGLRTLVALWLNERGYEIDPNNKEGFIAKEGHAPLTAAQFNELKNDPINGLNEFLNRGTELQYREELNNAPAPYGMAFAN